MFKRKITVALACIALSAGITVNVGAAGVAYMPYVTEEMSKPDFWSAEDGLLATREETEALNALIIAEKGTNMYDLKNHPETVDGISLNAALMKSTQADAEYYLGWTYLGGETLATQKDFDKVIKNTQNPKPKKVQKVRYGIAVERTALVAFPTDKVLTDDLADKDFDYRYSSSVRVNEPLVITSVSADGKYYLAKSVCCSGWVPSKSVAVCADKEEWLSAQNIPNEKALVVYGDKVYTEYSVAAEQTAGLMLTMGTVLEQADIQDPNTLVDNRALYQNYAVWLPVRNADGSYGKKLALISEHNKVSNGYLPLTGANISTVALSALGNIYGWGGNLFSEDCSGYVRNIYKCFGLELARNTTRQTAMPTAKADMRDMCREEREQVLDSLPIGTILFFKGHEMLYLGKQNGKYYVVSAVGTVMQPQNPSVRQTVRSVVINTLDVKRANGNSWLEDLTTAVIPYKTADGSNVPKYAWYHDGVAYCIKNKLMHCDEENSFNIDANISKGEFLGILQNCDSNPAETENLPPEQWALKAGILAQNSDTEALLTREELATLLYRYAKYKGFDTNKAADLAGCDNAEGISDYAVSAMEYAVGSGIIQGQLMPKNLVTRAETAVIVERFCKLNK